MKMRSNNVCSRWVARVSRVAQVARVVGTAAALMSLSISIASTNAQVAVKAKTLHTMDGAAIADGVVIVTDGKIVAIGPWATTKIPEGYRVLEAVVATPGLVDARATVGLSGLYNQRQDQDQLDRSGPIQPELRAIDAYNPMDALVAYLRSFGVTAVNAGQAPGELVSGQTALIKTVGDSVDASVVIPMTAVVATLGPNSTRAGGSPGTRAKQMAMLRQELLNVRGEMEKRSREEAEAAKKAKDASEAAPAEAKPADSQVAPASSTPTDAATVPPIASTPAASVPVATKAIEPATATQPDRDLRKEALGAVLRKQVPLIVTANRAQDISSALRLAKEFDITLILDGGAESYMLADQIKAAGVDVILHPSMQRASGESENLSFETASLLRKAGVRFAIQSGFEAYVPKTRVVLLEAAIAAANGLSFDEALASITIDAARILKADARIGSLAIGKDGDIALYDGDPFEYTTHCVGVVVDGVVVSEVVR